MITEYSGLITSLADGQVFVFTSNLQGFHGAGSAGYASFNVGGNAWRRFDYGSWADGTKGKWNIKGVGWGYQIGEIGASYAIPTVKHAGAKRSMPLNSIKKHIDTFYNFARGCSDFKFFIAQGAETGLSGYTSVEFASVWERHDIPANVCFRSDFAKLLRV